MSGVMDWFVAGKDEIQGSLRYGGKDPAFGRDDVPLSLCRIRV